MKTAVVRKPVVETPVVKNTCSKNKAPADGEFCVEVGATFWKLEGGVCGQFDERRRDRGGELDKYNLMSDGEIGGES